MVRDFLRNIWQCKIFRENFHAIFYLGQLPPTPHYNMSILEDLVAEQNEQLKLETFEGNQNLKDATILLSVWLQQRQLLKVLISFFSSVLKIYFFIVQI